jgi:hypothetical protein
MRSVLVAKTLSEAMVGFSRGLGTGLEDVVYQVSGTFRLTSHVINMLLKSDLSTESGKVHHPNCASFSSYVQGEHICRGVLIECCFVEHGVTAVIRPSADTVIAGLSNGELASFNVPSCSRKQRLYAVHQQGVNALVTNPSCLLAASGGGDSILKV